MPDDTWAILVFFLFATVWLGLTAWGLHRDRVETASLKKSNVVRRTSVAAGLFVAFALISFRGDWHVLWIVFPVSLICWIYLKRTSFCPKCNVTAYNYMGFSTLASCPRCDAELDPALAKANPSDKKGRQGPWDDDLGA